MIDLESGRTSFVTRRLGRLLGCASLTSCLGALLITIVVVGLVGGIFFLIISSFKSSSVYAEAMAAARSDPAVTSALGTPIDSGWLITGSLSEQGISGNADLVIPISGPRRGGTLYASGYKANGVWHFYTLAVQVDGDSELILLQR